LKRGQKKESVPKKKPRSFDKQAVREVIDGEKDLIKD